MNSENKFSLKDTNVHKGIAILMILGIHCFVRTDKTLYNYHWELGGVQALNYIFYQAKIFVTIFIILSGYGLNEKYKRNYQLYGGDKRYNFAFLKSGLSKLMTNFWVIFVLYAGVGLALGWVSINGTWGGIEGFVIDFLGLRDIVYDFNPVKTLNPTWWYMSTIIACYLLFPVIKKIMKYNAYIPVAFGIVLQIIAPFSVYRQAQYGFVFYFAAFALGILFSEKQVLNRIKSHEYKRKWLTVIIAIAVTLAAFLFRCYNKFWGDLPLALSMMFTVQLIVCSSNRISSFFANIFAFVGKHSFNIFALHTFYLTIYGKDLLYKLKNPFLIIFALALLSILSSVVIEKLKELSGIAFLQKRACDMERLLSARDAVPFDRRQSIKINGIAICFVVFHQLFNNAGRIAYSGVITQFISEKTLLNLASYARIGMWLFIFVYVYGLAKSYMSMGDKISVRDCMSYYKRHWLSLMKPYWIVWGIAFCGTFLFFVQPAVRLDKNIIYIILNFLGWSDFFKTPMMNNTWWYICLAQIILLLIPLLCGMIKRWGAVIVPLVIVLFQFINMAGIKSTYGGSYTQYIFIVLIAVMIARSDWLEKISSARFTFLEYVLLIIAICAGLYWNKEFASADKWNICGLLASLSAVGIIILSHRIGANMHGKFSKALCFLGKHSCYMLLVHTFLFEKSYFPPLVYWSQNVILSWITCIVLSLALSVLIYFIKNQVIRLNAAIKFSKGKNNEH